MGGIGKEADKRVQAHQANGGVYECKERRDLQQCSELPEKEIQVRPAKDVYNSAERLQEAIEHSSEDRDPGHGFEGNRYILLRITDIRLKFHLNMRLGPMCVVPTLNTKSKAVQTLQYNSFSTMGPMLFNRMLRMMKESATLAAFKTSLDDYLMKIPDTPPTPDYTPANSNSLLDWVNTNGRASQEVLS